MKGTLMIATETYSKIAASALVALCLLCPMPAQSGITFYDSEAEWLADVTDLETFLLTSENVATADEGDAAPGVNEQLETGVLTFQAVNTGLTTNFVR